MSQQRSCYGRFFSKRLECAECELIPYCKEAGDLPVNGIGIRFSDDFENESFAMPVRSHTSAARARQGEELRARLMSELTDVQWRAVEAVILMRMSYSQAGRELGVSKQAIHKSVVYATRRVPELAEAAPADTRMFRWGALLRLIDAPRRRRNERRPHDGRHQKLCVFERGGPPRKRYF